MKKFSKVFVILIALFITSFAQKKSSVDPCLSKDPKVRATSKKPCPSAPAPKKKDTVTPPKYTAGGDTSDGNEDSEDSDSNSKTNKKNNPPAKNKTPKPTDYLGTFFFITIIHNGEKTELANTQFEEGGGIGMIENEHNSRFLLNYGVSNSVKNDDNFAFQGMISSAAKGSYALGKDVNFSFSSTKFPNAGIFICESGEYEIEAVPLKGGFVTGSFTANCTGEINPDGTSEKYSVSGKFKLLRQ